MVVNHEIASAFPSAEPFAVSAAAPGTASGPPSGPSSVSRPGAAVFRSPICWRHMA